MTLSQRNIRLIEMLERSERKRRTGVESAIDNLAWWAGQPSFALLHLVWFAGWIAYNSLAPGPFDPYPFTFLTMVVSLEAILLASFVLAAQNRMSQEADRRAQLDLQLDMLSEQELTAILRSLDELAKHNGLDLTRSVPQLQELLSDTRVDRLAQALAAHGKRGA